jgi:hypothetical protein
VHVWQHTNGQLFVVDWLARESKPEGGYVEVSNDEEVVNFGVYS